MTLLSPDPAWHHDAIIYQLHVKAFRDSNRDGYGDFRGLLDKLDYIADLGVTAVWLLPFYPSPLKDDGYDIADYCGVHPSYGSLEVWLSTSSVITRRPRLCASLSRRARSSRVP